MHRLTYTASHILIGTHKRIYIHYTKHKIILHLHNSDFSNSNANLDPTVCWLFFNPALPLSALDDVWKHLAVKTSLQVGGGRVTRLHEWTSGCWPFYNTYSQQKIMWPKISVVTPKRNPATEAKVRAHLSNKSLLENWAA